MRIGFDLRPFLREETGVGVYFRHLLFALAAHDTANEYCLFSASWKDRFPADKIPPFRRSRFVDRRWPVRALDAAWSRFGRPRLDAVFRSRLDLTHSPTPLVLPTRGKTIVTVCDLFFMDEPARADAHARRHFLGRTESSLGRADGVIVISEFTKRAVLRRFALDERKIKVTLLGLNDAFREPADASEVERTRRLFDLPGEFLLFVGATEPRKNLSRLVDALVLVHKRYKKIPLVLVGRPGAGHSALVGHVKARNLESDVRILGYLALSDLRPLYHAAAAFVFPSSCEGFGLPLLEAMASGLPAAASGVSALPEIGGGAALYFDPDDAEDMADKMIAVLSDAALRAKLKIQGLQRAAAFTWDKTAAATLDFYRAVEGGL
jgi:glycosyltransferase involved in cell wall biosynthesis